jgi:hypothetical protein
MPHREFFSTASRVLGRRTRSPIIVLVTLNRRRAEMTTPKPRVKKIPVSASNIAKAAARLLSQRLVSPEVAYVQRTLGTSSTQEQIDSTVMAVRKMPWASIVVPE